MTSLLVDHGETAASSERPWNIDVLNKPSHMLTRTRAAGAVNVISGDGLQALHARTWGGRTLSTLTDAEIRAAVRHGALDIEPFSEEQLTPNGYDLAIAEVVLPDTGQSFLAGTAVIPPLTRFMVSTRERVRLGPAHAAQLWLRTSWARRGVVASFGRVDAGFDGTLTFGAFNASATALEVTIGDTFAQMVLDTMDRSAEGVYEQRSGHYQHQRGVTMAADDERERTTDVGAGPRVVPAPCLDRDCHECCLETEMPLTRRDVERLAARGHDPEAFTLVEDGFIFLANVQGRCFFLDVEGRCAEYGHRPEGCRLYPLVMDEEMSAFVMDHICPHSDVIDAAEEDETALMVLLDRMARERDVD
jgi:dCTP deaminase